MRTSHIALIFLLLIVTGCGGPQNPDGRIDVTGKITLNGELLNVVGNIFFDPVSGIHGDGGSTQTDGGKFHFTGEDAPKAGKYIVRISVIDYYDNATNKPRTPQTALGESHTVKVVPDDFNVNSKIEFEVVKGKKNVFNYDIVTPPGFKPVRLN